MNGQRFLSLGRLSVMFQRDAGDIADRLNELGIRPEMYLDDVAFFPARAVAELRSYFQGSHHGKNTR